MTGVPSSQGCEACRMKKKGCDQQKPICGRCKRVGIPCVGSGEKRWTFRSGHAQAQAQQTAVGPSRSPSNGKNRVESPWVFILGIGDVRYEVRPFDNTHVAELPRRTGPNSAFEVSISALVTTYDAIQYNQPKAKALSRFGDALMALRLSLQDPAEPLTVRIQTVYNIYICEQWIDPKQGLAVKHREVMAYLLRDAFYEGKLSEIEPAHTYGLCQFVVWECLINARIKLDPWFWQIISMLSGARPFQYQQGRSFMSLDLFVWAEIFLFLREPSRNQERIRYTYNFLRKEKPILREIVDQMTTSISTSQASLASQKLCVSYQIGYGQLLIMALAINRLYQNFSNDPELIQESHGYCNEAICLTRECSDFRPFGGIFVHMLLAQTWASMSDSYRHTELEELMAKYTSGYWGAGCLEEAMLIRQRLDVMGVNEVWRIGDGTNLSIAHN